jgi:hypothetical protein
MPALIAIPSLLLIARAIYLIRKRPNPAQSEPYFEPYIPNRSAGGAL